MERNVKNLLTWEKINAFPVKHKDMTVAQMRQLCADFFNFSKRSLWICKQDMDYFRTTKAQDKMEAGQVYGGLPYIGHGTGSVYRTLDYMDDNGVIDLAPIIGEENFDKVYKHNLFRNLGNQCANGAYVGWGRVINSAKYSGTTTMQACNGFLRVGPYTYDDSLDSYRKGCNTVAICEANGEQVMFESYAQLQLADGLVNYTTAGHVIMCTGLPVVVRNADGTINGEESYLYFTQQAQTWKEQENEFGDQYLMKPSVDTKRSFQKLFNQSYLPFTFAEFLGTHPIEDTVVNLSIRGDTITADELFKSHVTCNYGILDAYITVFDDNGAQLYRHAVRCLTSGCKDLQLTRYAEDPSDHDNVDFWGEYPAPGTYKAKIEVQLATGERPVIFAGSIVV